MYVDQDIVDQLVKQQWWPEADFRLWNYPRQIDFLQMYCRNIWEDLRGEVILEALYDRTDCILKYVGSKNDINLIIESALLVYLKDHIESQINYTRSAK